jgi:hypothetical protein
MLCYLSFILEAVSFLIDAMFHFFIAIGSYGGVTCANDKKVDI